MIYSKWTSDGPMYAWPGVGKPKDKEKEKEEEEKKEFLKEEEFKV